MVCVLNCTLSVLCPYAQAVSSWNPREDTVPIHAWIHPWLPLLGSRLSSVFPDIRRKLSQVRRHHQRPELVKPPRDLSCAAPLSNAPPHPINLTATCDSLLKMTSLQVLVEWHPSDMSAHVILSPWAGVFDAHGMEQLLLRSIMPKLVQTLKQLVIDPNNQVRIHREPKYSTVLSQAVPCQRPFYESAYEALTCHTRPAG